MSKGGPTVGQNAVADRGEEKWLLQHAMYWVLRLWLFSSNPSPGYSDLTVHTKMACVDNQLTAQPSTETHFRRVNRIAIPMAPALDGDTGLAPSSEHTEAGRHDPQRQTYHQSEADPQSPQAVEKSRFILAVDYGTTYSTVSYVEIGHGIDSASLGIADIQCIDNYNNAAGGADARVNSRIENVPTEILYLGSVISGSNESKSKLASETSSSEYATSGDERHKHVLPARRSRGKKRSARTSRSKAQSKWTRRPGVSLKWGFSVQDKQKYPQELQPYQEREAVKLIKLSLGDEAEHLVDKRKELHEQLRRLQSLQFVQDLKHILQDYLTRLLHHAKCMLKKEAGLQEASELEFVLCVPVSWSENACRVMHDAMAKAIEKCKLGYQPHEDVITNLFIVSEPEAAAQFVLATLREKGRLRKDEVFILLDAGGGTVDITTYKVTSDGAGPLRLQGEMAPPDGALCGSSFIAERYAASLRIKLLAENLPGNFDLEGTVTAMTNDWDLNYKSNFDFGNNRYPRRRIYVSDIGRNIEWTKEEARALFEPSLRGVTELLEKQLDLAAAKRLTISKVIVVGGFGESRPLHDRIEEVIATKRNLIGASIVTIWPSAFPTSAVARGAVLRALNKQDGPTRISRSSFGFLQHEVYQAFPEHLEAGVKPQKDKMDHYPNIKNTINWVINAVSKNQTPYVILRPALTLITARVQN